MSSPKIFLEFTKGESLNYLFQKYVTKSLPPDNNYFLGKVNTAFSHYENYKDYNQYYKKQLVL